MGDCLPHYVSHPGSPSGSRCTDLSKDDRQLGADSRENLPAGPRYTAGKTTSLVADPRQTVNNIKSPNYHYQRLEVATGRQLWCLEIQSGIQDNHTNFRHKLRLAGRILLIQIRIQMRYQKPRHSKISVFIPRGIT